MRSHREPRRPGRSDCPVLLRRYDGVTCQRKAWPISARLELGGRPCADSFSSSRCLSRSPLPPFRRPRTRRPRTSRRARPTRWWRLMTAVRTPRLLPGRRQRSHRRRRPRRPSRTTCRPRAVFTPRPCSGPPPTGCSCHRRSPLIGLRAPTTTSRSRRSRRTTRSSAARRTTSSAHSGHTSTRSPR